MSTSAPVELLVAKRLNRIAGYVNRIGLTSAAQLAKGWACAEDPQERELGILILGYIAIDDATVRGELLELINPNDQDASVRLAIAESLGDQSNNEGCTEILLQLVDDADESVRVKAIGGLGSTAPDPINPDHPAIAVLTRLLDDSSPTIRDWAAFAFGMHPEVDTPAIRDRLLTMAAEDVDTEETYPAAEAARALAIRRDERIIPIIAEHLTTGDLVGKLWLEAAATLGDRQLLPALEAVRAEALEDHDDWDEQLAVALNACRFQQPILD